MGLAASQARFLNLTARKTNIEYEGQQINQQRTTLANESANTYNQMLTLSVPTPPSETAYQTIVYNFKYNGDNATINQLVRNADTSSGYNYKVSFTYSTDVDKIAANGKGTVSNTGNGYTFSNTVMKKLNDADYSEIKDSVLAQINSKREESAKVNADDIYVAKYGTEKNISYAYFLKDEVENIESGKSQPITKYEEISEAEYNSEVIPANITRDANNRVAAISYKIGNTTYDNVTVSSSTVLDEAAYKDAYNEYEYQTYLYQQKMEAINAQTSVIQAQDKKLELRLKQLDTEQNAISTEMDSISSVLDKNIENSFKTFA